MSPNRKSDFYLTLVHTLIQEVNLLLQNEEDFWKLKSRVQNLHDGDANTKFFHLSTVHRRRKNRILGLYDSVGD